MKKLYYMTQYADYMTDEGYYESMEEQVKKLDGDLLSELMEIVPEVNDKYNVLLFDLLYSINNEDLEKIIKLWSYLKDDDIVNFLEELDTDYNDLLSPDDYIYEYYHLEEMADCDLRENGITADALYWVKKLEKYSSDDYFIFNGYGNDFYVYGSINEAVDDFIDFNEIKKILKEYFEK